MRIFFISLVTLLVSSFSFAKVAYLPIHNPGDSNVGQIMVLDIDTGKVLKYIDNPFEHPQAYNNAVFLNNSETKLYAGGQSFIAQIDTKTLEIENIYDLNTLFLDMFLNHSEDKLYTFTARNNIGSYFVDELDLNTNTLTRVLHFGQEKLRDYAVNDSLNTAVFITNDNFPLTLFRMRVIDINTMTEKYSHEYDISIGFPPNIQLIDNNGVDYYHSEGSQMFSAKLSDNSTNWVFNTPFESVQKVYDNHDGTITAVASNNTYTINKSTGLGDILSNFGVIVFLNNIDNSLDSFHSLKKIDNENYLAFNYPSRICPELDCPLDSTFTISNIHMPSNTISTVYQDDTIEGTDVVGKYIGEQFYFPPIQTIPVLNNSILILLLLGAFLIMAYKKRFL